MLTIWDSSVTDRNANPVPSAETAVARFLVPESLSVRQVMERLEATEEKIVFVVDLESRLVGSLTDGDIRRWILSDGDLKAPVARICNTSPTVVQEGFDADHLRSQMLERNLNCVPVVDSARHILQLVFWKEIFQTGSAAPARRPLSMPVVIMAGGKGTRLAPFTNILPKPLIPVGDRTIIEIIIDQFVVHGLQDFRLSVNYKSRLLKSFFEELAPPYSVSWLEETAPLGTAGALRALYDPKGGDVLVTNCDIIIQADLAELVDFHQDRGYDLTLVASLKDYNIPYGVCELEKSGSLARITEKPQYSFLVNTGMYVIRRDWLNMIPDGEPCDMTDLIDRVRQAGGRVGVFPIGGHAWIDTGEWAEYRKALDSFRRLGVPVAGD